MSKNLLAQMAMILLFGTALSSKVKAYEYDSSRWSHSNRDEGFHAVSVGGGIAAPADTSLFSESPAGLIYNRKPKVFVLMKSHPDSDQWLGTGAGLLVGNKLAAAGIGFQSFNNVRDSKGSVGYFNFGLASHIEPINITLALSGAYRTHGPSVVDNPITDPTWTANLSMLYNPDGTLRLSAIAYDVSKNVRAAGAGIAVNLNQYSILAFDTSFDTKGRGLTLKPGVAVAAGYLQMSYAYGVAKEPQYKSGIPGGNTFGIGYEINSNAQIQASYNQTSLYNLGLVLGF